MFGGQRPASGSVRSLPRYKFGAWRPGRKRGAHRTARLDSAWPSMARKASSSLQTPSACGAPGKGDAAVAQPRQGVSEWTAAWGENYAPQHATGQERPFGLTRASQVLLGVFIDLCARFHLDQLRTPLGPAPYGKPVTSQSPASCPPFPLLMVQPSCHSGARGKSCLLIGGFRLAPTRKGGRGSGGT